MSQQTRKCQHIDHQEEKEENGNGNEAKNGVISAVDLAKVNEENGALGEKLKEQMAKNEESPAVRRPLPLELNYQIFACLKFESQRKFIGGLGRGIYGMFRQKVLTKCKKLRNPEQNGWEVSNTGAIISSNGLLARYNTWQNVYSKKGFPITGQLSRKDNFPGTILYYFEVTNTSTFRHFRVGLSSGNNPYDSWVGSSYNSYAFHYGFNHYLLSGRIHLLERPNGAIEPEWNGNGDVLGCGLLLNAGNKLSIFFTGNGIFMGKQIPINSTVNLLYATVTSLYLGTVRLWPILVTTWKNHSNMTSRSAREWFSDENGTPDISASWEINNV